MGFYLNHESDVDGSKRVIVQALLNSGGRELTREEFTGYQPERGEVLLSCVDNGPFAALGVCVDERERQAFASTRGRPQRFFLVPIMAIKPYGSGIEKYITLGQ